ncbi:MAG: FHA domain-containing protein, partial [bacterium]
MTPPRTPLLPADKFTGWDGGPDPTTWLGEFDAAGLWHLPRNVKLFSVGGSRKLDAARIPEAGGLPVEHICIPGRGLSATHLLLERRADKLRVYDLHSTNGTFMRGHRIDMADVNPGDAFSPNPMTLIAMNDEMHRHRPTLYEIIGSGFRPSPDMVMIEAATESGPILITGERGCGHERLARAVHAMSLRRQQAIIELEKLPDARAAQIALAKQASQV